MAAIHTARAARVRGLTKGQKLVLMAIADGADKHTRISFPGNEEIAIWAEIGPSSIAAATALLVERGLLYKIGGGYKGRRVEYLVFPEPGEIEHYAAERERRRANPKPPRGRTLSTPEASATVDPSSTLDPSIPSVRPVDNGAPKPPPVRTLPNAKGSDSEAKGSTPADPYRHTYRDDYDAQSSRNVTTVAAVENSDDEISLTGSGQRAPRRAKASRELDIDAVLAAAPGIFEGVQEPREVAHGVALKILGKAYNARTSVMYPNRYIASALREESHLWRREAMSIDEQRRSNG